MITFTQTSPTNAQVNLNGVKTPYSISKGGTFYQVYYKGNPLKSYYSSQDKTEITELLTEIIDKPCKLDSHSNFYYVPVK